MYIYITHNATEPIKIQLHWIVVSQSIHIHKMKYNTVSHSLQYVYHCFQWTGGKKMQTSVRLQWYNHIKTFRNEVFAFNLSCVVYLYFQYFSSFCWQYLQTFSWMFTGLLLMFSNIVVLLLVLQWGIGCRTESLHLYKRKGSKYSFILYLMMMMSVSSSKSECINCWEWRKSRASI